MSPRLRSSTLVRGRVACIPTSGCIPHRWRRDASAAGRFPSGGRALGAVGLRPAPRAEHLLIPGVDPDGNDVEAATRRPGLSRTNFVALSGPCAPRFPDLRSSLNEQHPIRPRFSSISPVTQARIRGNLISAGQWESRCGTLIRGARSDHIRRHQWPGDVDNAEQPGVGVNDFERVLKKLVEREDYRDAVIEDWSRLTADYKELNPQEILLLMQVWAATDDPRVSLSDWFMCHCCCGA